MPTLRAVRAFGAAIVHLDSHTATPGDSPLFRWHAPGAWGGGWLLAKPRRQEEDGEGWQAWADRAAGCVARNLGTDGAGVVTSYVEFPRGEAALFGGAAGSSAEATAAFARALGTGADPAAAGPSPLPPMVRARPAFEAWSAALRGMYDRTADAAEVRAVGLGLCEGLAALAHEEAPALGPHFAPLHGALQTLGATAGLRGLADRVRHVEAGEAAEAALRPALRRGAPPAAEALYAAALFTLVPVLKQLPDIEWVPALWRSAQELVTRASLARLARTEDAAESLAHVEAVFADALAGEARAVPGPTVGLSAFLRGR